MHRPLLLMACAAIAVLATSLSAIARPIKVAMTPIEGDTIGLWMAMEDALDDKALEVVSTRRVGRLIERLGLEDDLPDRDIEKLAGELKVDVIVQGVFEPNTRKARFTIFANGKRGKPFNVRASNAGTEQFRKQMHTTMMAKLAAATAVDANASDRGGTASDDARSKKSKKADKQAGPKDDDEVVAETGDGATMAAQATKATKATKAAKTTGVDDVVEIVDTDDSPTEPQKIKQPKDSEPVAMADGESSKKTRSKGKNAKDSDQPVAMIRDNVKSAKADRKQKDTSEAEVADDSAKQAEQAKTADDSAKQAKQTKVAKQAKKPNDTSETEAVADSAKQAKQSNIADDSAKQAKQTKQAKQQKDTSEAEVADDSAKQTKQAKQTKVAGDSAKQAKAADVAVEAAGDGVPQAQGAPESTAAIVEDEPEESDEPAGDAAPRADAKQVAERDDDAAPRARARFEPSPPATHSANRAGVRVDLGAPVSTRELRFKSTALDNAPKGYKNAPVPGGHVEAELYPFALYNPNSWLAGIGVAGDFDQTIALTLRPPAEMTVPLKITARHYAYGLRFRLAFGHTPTSPTLTFGGGYGRRTFAVDRTGLMTSGSLDLPDVDYKLFDPGLAFRLPLGGRVAVTLGGRALLVTSAGQIQRADQYGKAKILGGTASASLELIFGNRVAFRVAAEATQLDYTFAGTGTLATNRDGDAATLDVRGATDRYLGGTATLAVLY